MYNHILTLSGLIAFLGLNPSPDRDKVEYLAKQLKNLTPSQLEWVQAVIKQFKLPHTFLRENNSDLIDDTVLEMLGDALRIHHAFSRQALSKDRFEFALETALTRSGIEAKLIESRTNRGLDITIKNFRVSLKTEAAKNINPNSLHISKFMELGKGVWDLEILRKQFLDHMINYDRIFQFRCVEQGPVHYLYELIEIPKELLEEAEFGVLQVREDSSQDPKPGYCRVYDKTKNEKFALYFDGGTERKLQIKAIRKDLCIKHASWEFDSTSI
ncbi:MAG: restriction endonuclease [Leptospirales bacterium]